MEVEISNSDHLLNKIITEYRGVDKKEFDSINEKKVSKNSSLWKSCSRSCFADEIKNIVKNGFPLLEVVRSYDFKEYFFSDFISGLSVALMAIPQSFGYARIAKIPEIIGLYTSFFPVIIYFCLTTSKHVSLGTMALASLLIGSVINTLELPSEIFHKLHNDSITHMTFNNSLEEVLREQDDEMKILMTVSLSCAAGIILLVMSFCKMGSIVSLMSDSFVSGFLASSTLRVFVLEVKDVMGVRPGKRHSGFCEFFLNTYELFKGIAGTNLVQLGMSVVTLVILVSVKEFINKRYSKKLKIPIPIEIIVVVISVIVTKFSQLESKFAVEVSTGMRSGLPSVILPSPTMMFENILTSFLLAIICFMLVGMMAKVFAQSHGYHVNNNQEMFAMGVAGIFGSFFCCMMPSTSPPRCFLGNSTGVKTQLAHLFTALFALLSMLALAPLLKDLPVCVLACIIIVSLIPLLPHFRKFCYYWRASKYDFATWCVTFATVLLFSVETGMLVGVSFSLMMVHVLMKMDARSSVLDKNYDGLFLDRDLYAIRAETESDGPSTIYGSSIVVCRFESPLYFGTLDNFKDAIFTKVPSYVTLEKSKLKLGESGGCKIPSCFKKKALTQVFQPGKEIEELKEISDAPSSATEKLDVIETEGFTVEIQDRDITKPANSDADLKCIILDCSNVAFCDCSGAELLAQMNARYRNVGIEFCLASCSENVIKQLERTPASKDLVENHLYPSIPDAYLINMRSI